MSAAHIVGQRVKVAFSYIFSRCDHKQAYVVLFRTCSPYLHVCLLAQNKRILRIVDEIVGKKLSARIRSPFIFNLLCVMDLVKRELFDRNVDEGIKLIVKNTPHTLKVKLHFEQCSLSKRTTNTYCSTSGYSLFAHYLTEFSNMNTSENTSRDEYLCSLSALIGYTILYPS